MRLGVGGGNGSSKRGQPLGGANSSNEDFDMGLDGEGMRNTARNSGRGETTSRGGQLPRGWTGEERRRNSQKRYESFSGERR